MLVREDLHDEPLSVRNAEGNMTHWQLSAKPQFDIHGKFAGYRGIALDVTAIRVETHAVIKAEDHAKRSYETKAQFLMQMAQELRNPVNAIVSFSEMLGSAKGAALPPVVRRDYMNTIFNSGRQVQSLVDDVLEASRLERGLVKLEEQKDDFTTLIETAIKEIVPRAALTQVSVVARLYEDVEVAGDLARLKTLIAALVSRAVTSAPHGSAVQVEMLRTENGDLGLILRDKGTALSLDAAKRAVVPFAGLDLGLPMARAVARLHGGDIMLVAGKDGGTEARLLLPAARIAWHPVDGQLKVMNIAA
jgi:signal transduction histidine kinase